MLCAGDTLKIRLPISGDSIEWSDGYTSFNRDIDQPGSYQYSIYRKQCTLIDSFTITATDTLPLTIIGDTFLCSGQGVELSSSISGETYLWNNNKTSSSIFVTSGGLFTLEVHRHSCVGRDSINVESRLSPSISLPALIEFCSDSIIDLSLYEYDSILLDNVLSEATSISISKNGMYNVLVYKNGCSTASLFSANDTCNLLTFIPDAITPNNDGLNDVFRPVFSKTISPETSTLKIFNQWGEMIYSQDFMGQIPSWGPETTIIKGTYMYNLTMRINKEIFHFSGIIHVIQ